MSGTGFPSFYGLDDAAAWAVPVQPGVPDTRPAPESAQPADAEAQLQAVVKLVVEAQQDAYHAGMAHDGSISSQSAAFQKALQIESAIRRLVGGK
jgi:hypothetical protein